MSHVLYGFVEIANKHIDITKLTQTIVNEYIRKTEVFASDKFSGNQKQKTKTYRKFVDKLNLEISSQSIIYEQITNQTQKMQKTVRPSGHTVFWNK